MKPESRIKLRNLLHSHEGYEQFPYMDTTNNLTIGIGRNLSFRGISLNEADFLLDGDITYFNDRLNEYLPFFKNMSEERQIALIDMCFNLGFNGFMKFKKMLLALERKDYEEAANEMIKSDWAEQVKKRAIDLSNIIRTGKL